MNVAFDPWIPVVTTTGKRKLASLVEVFTEGGEFADLAVRPHERVSLMRFFLCVAHAAFDGPKDDDEWYEVPKRLPETVHVYLGEWKDSFELFHEEKPWLQVAELDLLPSNKSDAPNDTKGWSALHKLCFTKASGNNSTLFDHESNDNAPTKYGPEEIVLNLLTFQNFFVAGGKASSRMWGNIEMKNPPNPKGGPCAGKSILFTFLRDVNLFKSIWLNLNSYEDLKLIYGNEEEWLGKPIWELPIKSPTDNEAIANATQTHIGRLVPQTRILRVNQDCKRVFLGAGFLYPKFQDNNNPFHPDVFATTVSNAQGERALLSARPNVATWRELHSLTVRRKDASSLNSGPLCLLNVPDGKDCDIIVNSMVTNPKQAAEIVDFVEAVFYVPARLRFPEGTIIYESEVKIAELCARRLGRALEDYRREIDGGWEGRVKAAGPGKGELKAKIRSVSLTNYWTTVEKKLPLLMAHTAAVGTDDAVPTRKAWRKMLFRAACDAYAITCGQETPRQMRAFAKGWQKLTEKKNKSKQDTHNKKEGDA